MSLETITGGKASSASRAAGGPFGVAAPVVSGSDLDNAEAAGMLNSSPSSWSKINNGAFGKSLNIYWLATSGLAVWFLFVHTPPILIRNKVFQQDPLLVLHILGAGGIYVACIHNALLTPSTFQGRSLPWHIWVGRAGMILGVIGVATGAILTWTRIDRLGLSFGIPITIGGIFQLGSQWRGYHFIQLYRQAKVEELKCTYMMMDGALQEQQKQIELQEKQKTYLSYHISYMIGVFVIACGVPAVFRVLENVEDAWPLIVTLVGFNVLAVTYSRFFIHRLSVGAKPATTENATEETRLLSF
ncbi:hypothetical protein ACA910_020442 [Epithemia clementina (nom. ined.)]